MALSYRQYAADGVTRDFAVPFQYIDRRHVSVLVDGASVPFSWISNFTVRATTAPARSTVVTVKRDTPKDQVLVDYVDGSTLTEIDLDLGTVQNFFLAQEAYDIADGTLSINEDGSFSARSRRIGDLADPQFPHQAATKNYVDTAMSSQVAQAVAARQGSEAALGRAETSEARTTQKAAESASSAVASAAARDSASGHRLNAQNAERGAQTAADRSESGASRSEAAAATLTDEAARAEDAADRASTSAANAATFDPSRFYTKTEVDGVLAPRASPVFTGNPSAPTPPTGIRTTRIATTASVGAELTAHVAKTAGYIQPGWPHLSATFGAMGQNSVGTLVAQQSRGISISNGAAVVPITGRYRLRSQFVGAISGVIYMAYSVNGASVGIPGFSSGQNATSSTEEIMQLNAGDTIRPFSRGDSTASTTSGFSTFVMEFLG